MAAVCAWDVATWGLPCAGVRPTTVFAGAGLASYRGPCGVRAGRVV